MGVTGSPKWALHLGADPTGGKGVGAGGGVQTGW